MAPKRSSFLDRALSSVAPVWHLRRVRSRIAAEQLQRHYEAASTGRRTQNWNKAATDANAVNAGTALNVLRQIARDMVRNNPYAESALSTIVDHTVGWGIVPKARTALPPRALEAWRAWSESPACDADGRNTFAGLQSLVMRTVAESGEALVRRRWRRLEDGFPIPLQLQVMEPDHLDTGRNAATLPSGGRIVQGVEYDAIGRRVAYWLFAEHPGSSLLTNGSTTYPGSRRIDAVDLLHVFKSSRAGQVRAATWFRGVITRLKDLDEYEDATLMKQKIAACLAVITSDVDGTGAPLGTADDTENPGTDTLEPGAVLNIPPGRNIEVVQPPAVGEYGKYVASNLRAVATGLHITYEDLAGDFSQVNFSSARMARLKHQSRVRDWRWNMLIPQFCDPVWAWAMQGIALQGTIDAIPTARWSAPPLPMIDPANEGLAYQRNVRCGFQSWSDAVRELGFDPDELLQEIADEQQKFDAAGIVLDSDPRRMTQAGQAQVVPALEDADGKGAA